MDGVPKITFNCIPKYIKNGTLIQRKKRAKISKLVKHHKKFPPAYCQLILVYKTIYYSTFLTLIINMSLYI